MKVDTRIRGGRVIDPARGVDRIEDVLIRQGKIVAPQGSDPIEATLDVNAEGCIVTPGLIDFHTHVFGPGSDFGVSADAACFPAGVTSVVDGGSSGTSNVELFLATMLMQKIRSKAFMHVCPAGQPTLQFHEVLKPENWDTVRMAYLLEKHKETLLGLKIRFSVELVEGQGEKPLARTMEIAADLGVRACVHITNPPVDTERLLEFFRPGDIFCHTFHGRGITIVENGKVKPAVKEAQKRGVIFDACNGKNHFAFDTALPALADGFFPDVISTDLAAHTVWRSPVCSLPYVMSKYIAMGCDLNRIVAATTQTPARLMGWEGKAGTLAPGAFGDVAVFKLVERQVTFFDTFDKSYPGSALLVPQMTLLGGTVVFRQLTTM